MGGGVGRTKKGSGHGVYTFKVEQGNLLTIVGMEDGKPMVDREGECAWCWTNTPTGKAQAEAFWETLKEMIHARGDLRATFIDKR